MSATGRIRGYATEMGPSWVAGAIAAGPATMATLITAGAGYGYDLLWVVVLSAFAGALAQYLAMRLGLLTERGSSKSSRSTSAGGGRGCSSSTWCSPPASHSSSS